MRCTTYAVKSICVSNHVCNGLFGSPMQGAACVTQSSVCAPAPAGPGGRVKGLPVWRLPHLSPMNSPVRRLKWTHRRTVTYRHVRHARPELARSGAAHPALHPEAVAPLCGSGPHSTPKEGEGGHRQESNPDHPRRSEERREGKEWVSTCRNR